MGRIYRKKRDFDLALPFLLSAQDKDPNYGPAYYEMGLVYSQLGVLDQAIWQYEQAVRLQPTVAGYRLTLAVAYQSAGDVARAIAEYQQVLALDPQNTIARRALESLEGVKH